MKPHKNRAKFSRARIDSVKSSKMQSHTVSRVEEKEFIQCINKKVETKSKQQKYQNPSHTVFNKKNCQVDKKC